MKRLIGMLTMQAIFLASVLAGVLIGNIYISQFVEYNITEDKNSAALIEGEKLKKIYSRSLALAPSDKPINTEEAIDLGVFDGFVNFIKYADRSEPNFSGVVRIKNNFGGSIDVDIAKNISVLYTGVDSGEDCASFIKSQKETGWSSISVNDWDDNFGGYFKKNIINMSDENLSDEVFRDVCSASYGLTDIEFTKDI